MSSVDYEHRLAISLIDNHHRWHIATWRTEQPTVTRPFFIANNSQEVRRAWELVVSARKHPRLLQELDGWAGAVVHEAWTYERWANDDGTRTGWAMKFAVDGTSTKAFGVCVPDPRDEFLPAHLRTPEVAA